MQSKAELTTARMLRFAGDCIELSNRLGSTVAGRYIAGQLLRAACSAGANYQEACGAESRADFVHKIQIVVKELRESDYWLKLLGISKLLPAAGLAPLLKEADELTRIMVKSAVTAKSRTT